MYAEDLGYHNTKEFLGEPSTSVTHTVVPALCSLAKDVSNFDIRQSVAIKIPKLAEFLLKQGSKDGLAVIFKELYPVLMDLSVDMSVEVVHFWSSLLRRRFERALFTVLQK